MKKIVSFRRMEDGTREDYLLLDQSERDFALGLPDRLLAALGKLDSSLDGYPVTRLEHSLQVATRADAAGADEELVLGALIHDIGDELAPYNHAEVTWIVEQHGLFQTYYYVHHLGGDRLMRERLKGHPWYDACVAFCDWDQASFDPDYATRPLEHFEPLLRRIFSRAAHDARYVGVTA